MHLLCTSLSLPTRIYNLLHTTVIIHIVQPTQSRGQLPIANFDLILRWWTHTTSREKTPHSEEKTMLTLLCPKNSIIEHISAFCYRSTWFLACGCSASSLSTSLPHSRTSLTWSLCVLRHHAATIVGFGGGGGGGGWVATTVTVHTTPRMLTCTQRPSLIQPDHMATMRTQIQHSSTACHEASTASWPCISIPAYQHPSTQDLHRHCISIPAHIST